MRGLVEYMKASFLGKNVRGTTSPSLGHPVGWVSRQKKDEEEKNYHFQAAGSKSPPNNSTSRGTNTDLYSI